MNSKVNEPTNEGLLNCVADLKVNEDGKVVDGREAGVITIYSNLKNHEQEILGDNPISIRLQGDREQEER